MLKNERAYRAVCATRAQACKDLIQYIDGFYNGRRRHSALGYRCPNEVHYEIHQSALASQKKPLIPMSENPVAARPEQPSRAKMRRQSHFRSAR